jgi:taurine transport system permease protein
MLDRVTRAKPAKAGKIFGAPGDGSSGLISFVTAAVLVAMWFLVTESGWVKPLFLPSPLSVWDKFWLAMTEGVSNSTLAQHTLASIGRVFGAFLLALVTAVPIGILMGVNRFVRGLFDPIIEFYRPLPPLAYLPLVIIWLGIGEFPKVFLIYLAIFAPMAIAARAGVRSVSTEQIHAAYAMGATRGPGHQPGHHEGGPAGDLHRHAHRHRRRLDDPWSPPKWSPPTAASASWCSMRRKTSKATR